MKRIEWNWGGHGDGIGGCGGGSVGFEAVERTRMLRRREIEMEMMMMCFGVEEEEAMVRPSCW